MQGKIGGKQHIRDFPSVFEPLKFAFVRLWVHKTALKKKKISIIFALELSSKTSTATIFILLCTFCKGVSCQNPTFQILGKPDNPPYLAWSARDTYVVQKHVISQNPEKVLFIWRINHLTVVLLLSDYKTRRARYANVYDLNTYSLETAVFHISSHYKLIFVGRNWLFKTHSKSERE